MEAQNDPEWRRAAGRTPDYRWSGTEVWQLRTPVVYVFIRDGVVLYVGAGQSVVRPLAQGHHQLGDVRPGDELLVWRQPTREHAALLETKLIRALRPVLNRAGIAAQRREPIAEATLFDQRWALLREITEHDAKGALLRQRLREVNHRIEVRQRAIDRSTQRVMRRAGLVPADR